MNQEDIQLKNKIKDLIANLMGIEPEDIEDDFSLKDDLHMTKINMADFVNLLEKEGFDTDEIDFLEIDTVSDLLEVLV